MKVILFALPLVSCLGTGALADAGDDAKALAMAIEGSGCVLTPRNTDSIVEESGLTSQQAQAAFPHLSEIGALEELSPGVMAFRSDTCAAQGIDGDRVVFVKIIEQHGCLMTEEVAQELLPANGFEKDQVKQIVIELVAKGMATVEDGQLTLTTETCS